MNLNIWEQKEWVVLTEDGASVFEATISQIDTHEIKLFVYRRLEPGETINICPLIEGKDIKEYSAEDILNHKNQVEVRVKRMEGANTCVLSYNAGYNEWKKWNRESSFEVKCHEGGIQCLVSGSGFADAQDLKNFIDCVNHHAKHSFRIILDFSGFDEIPKTQIVFIKDLLEGLLRINREVAVVNVETVSDSIPHNKNLKDVIYFCSSLQQAQNYFYEKAVNVLLIEDEEITAKRISRFLEARNMNVHTAHSAEQGMELLGEVLPQLILMDIHLPQMNGVEAAQKIKQNSYAKHTPLFMLTNENNPEFVLKSKEADVDGYILKPLTESGFQTKLLPAIVTSPKVNAYS